MRNISALLTLFLAAPALGQAPPAEPPRAAFDLKSKLLNVPDTNWAVYGSDQTNVRNEKGGPQGYPSIRVDVTRAGKNSWDVGAVSLVPKPVAAGDVILVAMHLRAPTLADGQTIDLPLVGATGAAAPYPAVAQAQVRITNQWKLYFAAGTASQAFAANGMQATLHLGGAPHVVELGPVRVYDLGQGFDLKRLPHN